MKPAELQLKKRMITSWITKALTVIEDEKEFEKCMNNAWVVSNELQKYFHEQLESQSPQERQTQLNTVSSKLAALLIYKILEQETGHEEYKQILKEILENIKKIKSQ